MHYPSKFIALCLIVSLIETNAWAVSELIGSEVCDTSPHASEVDTIPPTALSIKKIGNGIDNSCRFDNRDFSAQGFAFWQNVGYRLYDTGLCQTYDMSNLDSLSRIATFGFSVSRRRITDRSFRFSYSSIFILYRMLLLF